MSIWKTPDQKPDGFKPHRILVIYEAHDEPELMFSPQYDTLTDHRYVNRWCYWDEFIAQADKAERLQKAVDYALQVLDNVSEIGGIDLEMIKIEQMIKENLTSKLKCPFCLTELEQMHDKKMFGCSKCLHIADGAFWKKTIQAKQDLEIAKNGLNKVITKTNSQVVRGFEYIATGIVKVAKDTLKQIGHKE